MNRGKGKEGGRGKEEGKKGEGGKEKKGGGVNAFSDWLKGGGAKLFIKKIREGQQFEVHFKSGPLPKLKVGFMQSHHLMVVCDMNFN